MDHAASSTTLIGDSKLGLTQLAELVTVQMAGQSAADRDEPLVHIFTDSSVVANKLVLWPGQWQQDDFHIQGHPTWGPPVWRYTTQVPVTIEVIHVALHTKLSLTATWTLLTKSRSPAFRGSQPLTLRQQLCRLHPLPRNHSLPHQSVLTRLHQSGLPYSPLPFLNPWQNGPISLRVMGRCCHLGLGQGCLAYGSRFKTHCLKCKLCSQTKLWKLSHQALVPQGNHPFSPLISQGYFLCQQALWTSLLLHVDTFISLLLATPTR